MTYIAFTFKQSKLNKNNGLMIYNIESFALINT